VSAIRASGLERRFGYAAVLRDLELDVALGEKVVITGANGSGKTTLLRILAGLLRPTSGDVAVLGGDPRSREVRRRVGLISHAPSLYSRMRPSENLRFWSRMYDVPDGEEHGREILASLGLDPGDRRTVSTYSQGMRQRVSVARGLCTDPTLVLADEPLAGLDSDGATAVADLLDKAPTVVAVMHDPGTLEGWRRLHLRRGKLEA
jgi:heme exporter protein A